MRAYKTVNDSYIEPISFTVPRRAETFQADIFPPAVGTKPACSAKDWLDGKTGIPSKIDLESVYEGTAPKEVAFDYKAPTAQSTPTTPKAETTKREEPQPKREEPKPAAVSRAPPPSIKDQKSSISNMANKFQDNEEDDEDDADTTSSFEDIGRPAQRNPVPVRAAAEPRLPTKTTSAPAPTPAAVPAAAPIAPAKAATPSRSTPAGASASGGSGVESSLEQIKQLIENQTKIITQQNDKIGQLTQEVELLKRKVGTAGSQDQIERIRQLELELEEARS